MMDNVVSTITMLVVTHDFRQLQDIVRQLVSHAHLEAG